MLTSTTFMSQNVDICHIYVGLHQGAHHGLPRQRVQANHWERLESPRDSNTDPPTESAAAAWTDTYTYSKFDMFKLCFMVYKFVLHDLSSCASWFIKLCFMLSVVEGSLGQVSSDGKDRHVIVYLFSDLLLVTTPAHKVKVGFWWESIGFALWMYEWFL